MAYLALSTANLPNPAIDPAQGASPEDHFNTVLYTGTGAAVDINTVGFQPDLVWGKKRSAPNQNNWLIDSVRGAGVWLASDGTGAEGTEPAGSSFDADGFNTNSNSLFTYTGGSYVLWAWKANGSGVSNTDGSITSTVSANTTSGFSVLTYTGNGTNGSTIGHGLGATPTFFIVKRRDGTGWSWYTYHKDGKGALGSLYLNSSGTGDTDSTHWNNTAPTSSVITLGTANGINQSSGTYVCYAFAPVDGFSKFGSYVGNGSTDGPFVYTGFRPAFVMMKRTDSTQDWAIFDNKRNPSNAQNNLLRANLSDAEVQGNDIDCLSNGFKPRTTALRNNASGGTYIYMAFSANPFKFSTAF